MAQQTSTTFAAAVRAALAESDSYDMRQVARAATSKLDPEQILEAALSHLSSMARRYYNEAVRSQEMPGPDSVEVVSLRGRDELLRDVDETDREWLARNREQLAAGLAQSAERLRAGVGPDPQAGAVLVLNPADVARLERRVRRLAHMVKLIRRMRDDPDTEAAARIKAANEKLRAAECRTKKSAALAKRIVDGWDDSTITKTRFGRSQRVINDLKEWVNAWQVREAGAAASGTAGS